MVAACLVWACTSQEQAASKPVSEQREPTPKGRDEATRPSPPDSDELTALRARLHFKPDPYGDPLPCIAEPEPQRYEALTLWASLALTRDDAGKVVVREAAFSVTNPLSVGAGSRPQQGIPRLEVVSRDGRVEGWDFAGELRDDEGRSVSTRDVAPGDPTVVPTWLARAPIDADVVAHRIVLDGVVLRETTRPAEPPALTAVSCDESSGDALKLSWHAASEARDTPLFVDVMDYREQGFQELMPAADARRVRVLSIPHEVKPADRDLLLKVSVTDTFSVVSRAVLVPRDKGG